VPRRFCGDFSHKEAQKLKNRQKPLLSFLCFFVAKTRFGMIPEKIDLAQMWR
jgi:hypothetical protein